MSKVAFITGATRGKSRKKPESSSGFSYFLNYYFLDFLRRR